ncbi:TniQ family protein [Undibacterium sp. RuTC16W]|uniref:TniQ family protein n=1 Tax=Undibacterium sp. RuTC16W TaxID=3413048 RepID=UPI003BF3FF10
MTEQYFLVAPKIIPGEALSSWIHRLCQSHGISTKRLYKLLNFRKPEDVDSEEFPEAILKLMSMTRHDIENFQLVKAVNRSILLTEALRKQLRTGLDQSPTTAFCWQCLRTDAIPYYRIEWRFYFWQTCPKHLVDILTRCPYCLKSPDLRSELLVSNNATPSLAFCYFCQFYFGDSIQQIQSEFATSSVEQIKTQQSMMASVVYGYFQIHPWAERFPLQSMFHLYNAGLLASDIKSDSCSPPAWGEGIFSSFLHFLDSKLETGERAHVQISAMAESKK